MKLLKYLTIFAMYLTIFLFVALIIPIDVQYDKNKDSETFMNESIPENSENVYEKQYERIQEKVIPYIVNAEVMIENQKVVGEVLEDKGNGKTYCININNEQQWFSKYYVTILNGEELKLEPLKDEEIEFYVNYHHFESSTDYFIWVDIYRNETYILKKTKDYFFLYKRLICSTGANNTPTKRGLYTITTKGTHFYSRDNTYICYNYLQYSGSYLLHSFPYSLKHEVLDSRLQDRVSNGCVRYTFEDSKYLYEDIPLETTIWLN